jgi:hypothetical protein
MPGAEAKKFDKFLHLTAHGPMGGPLKNIIGGRRPRRAESDACQRRTNLKLLLLAAVATIFGHPAKEPKRR